MKQAEQTLNQRINQSNKHLAIWTGTWLVSTALLAFGPKLIWDFATALTILAILLNLAAGAGMTMANIRHLQSLDELGRKVFLDAAAITLGVMVVFGVCYELVSFAGAQFAFEARISHIYFVLGPTFFISMLIGTRRYK
ncbi:hypothetical protein [Glaciecola petra]|uniref:Uncharacterized protein n=1 Tax=Glaciecola petra TaxID=3075602 RepID=A0ABU2ZQR8_9ALTE|nr:hypothetical protein [Aestuariibacter sp. P117]MDT0594957.1 hypothetical protein [Aestuariibacter sp. P117]